MNDTTHHSFCSVYCSDGSTRVVSMTSDFVSVMSIGHNDLELRLKNMTNIWDEIDEFPPEIHVIFYNKIKALELTFVDNPDTSWAILYKRKMTGWLEGPDLMSINVKPLPEEKPVQW